MIPFNIPYVSENSVPYIAEAIREGTLQGDGKFSRLVVQFLSSLYGHHRILLTPSGTHALELALMATEMRDDAIARLPSYNFTSDGNAIAKFGVKLRFVDIDKNTGSTTKSHLLDDYASPVQLVSFVNYAGLGPEAEEIAQVARERNIVTIEDNAHGIGGKQNSKHLGTFGDFSALSFHSTKNFPIGEGGALVVNNSKFWDKCLTAREKGTNRHKFIMGKVDKYTWQSVGSSYLMNEISAAFLLAQLEDFDTIQSKRKKISDVYFESFEKGNLEAEGFSLMPIPMNSQSANHFFFLLAKDQATRDLTIHKLRGRGVQVTSHYEPLHSSPFGSKVMLPSDSCLENSQAFSETVIRLPTYPDLSLTDAEKIAGMVVEVTKSKKTK